jgi:hypothetical protein
MNTSETVITPKLFQYIPLIEKILLVALVIGTILALMEIDMTVVTISLFGLAATFFLRAFQPPKEIRQSENETFGFSELLTLSIIPKVLWISSAVSSIGVAFYLINFENKGYKQMLLIGIMSIGAGLVLFTIFLLTGVKHLKIIVPVLLRAIPVSLAAIYFFLK